MKNQINYQSDKKTIWMNQNHPLLILAPMAGYTDSAFRLLCREMGADLVVTELISADAIAFSKFKVQKSSVSAGFSSLDGKIKIKVNSSRNKSTAELLSFYKAEKPLIIQLFGKNSINFGIAAKWISENLPVDGIDINMGCPARKVVGSDHGAALLKNPELAIEIIKSVKENTHLPVSVKTRLGWENDDEILEFAPLLAKAGINAITIHGRTYKDGFSGSARWENIYKVKEILGNKVAVIGNGDIGPDNLKFNPTSPRLRRARIQKSKLRHLDGIAIGRAAFGNPWIFQKKSKIKNLPCRQAGQKSKKSHKELKDIVLRHAELVYEMKGEHGIIEFRKHLLAYLKGFSGAKELRALAVKIEKLDDVRKILEQM